MLPSTSSSPWMLALLNLRREDMTGCCVRVCDAEWRRRMCKCSLDDDVVPCASSALMHMEGDEEERGCAASAFVEKICGEVVGTDAATTSTSAGTVLHAPTPPPHERIIVRCCWPPPRTAA